MKKMLPYLGASLAILVTLWATAAMAQDTTQPCQIVTTNYRLALRSQAFPAHSHAAKEWTSFAVVPADETRQLGVGHVSTYTFACSRCHGEALSDRLLLERRDGFVFPIGPVPSFPVGPVPSPILPPPPMPGVDIYYGSDSGDLNRFRAIGRRHLGPTMVSSYVNGMDGAWYNINQPLDLDADKEIPFVNLSGGSTISFDPHMVKGNQPDNEILFMDLSDGVNSFKCQFKPIKQSVAADTGLNMACQIISGHN